MVTDLFPYLLVVLKNTDVIYSLVKVTIDNDNKKKFVEVKDGIKN